MELTDFSTTVFDSFVLQKIYLCSVFIFRCIRKIANSNYHLRHVCPSTLNNSAPIGRIFSKIRLVQVTLKSDKNYGHFTCSRLYIDRSNSLIAS